MVGARTCVVRIPYVPDGALAPDAWTLMIRSCTVMGAILGPIYYGSAMEVHRTSLSMSSDNHVPPRSRHSRSTSVLPFSNQAL